MTLAEQTRLRAWHEANIEIAKRMLQENVEHTFISKITELSLDKLKELQQQIETLF